MFRKPETEQQLADMIQSFQPINDYIQNHQKVSDALIALDDKVMQAEDKYKEHILNAGAIEAKRMLGELTPKEEKSLNVSLTDMRDEKDRLQYAKHALEAQSNTLQKEARAKSDYASKTVSQFMYAMEKELEEELQEAASRIVSVIHRLHALYEGLNIRTTKREIFKMEITSIANGNNLFIPPTRIHSSLGEEYTQPWKSDASAMAIYERLKEYGSAYRKLQRLEREAEKILVD